MLVTLTSPRRRPAHLASFDAPEGVTSRLLKLTGNGDELIAERDPSLPVYSVHLPSVAPGEAISYTVKEIDEAPPCTSIEAEQSDDSVAILIGDSPLMTFKHGDDVVKPTINPILTPGGTNMLREPMPAWGEGEHPWQRGLTLMQGAINGIDCWNEKAIDTHGRTEQDSLQVDHGPVSLLLSSDNSWYCGDKKLMTDHRTYRLFDSPRDAVILDIALSVKASEGPVTIGDTKEGGFLCIRVNPSMNAKDGGTMQNAYGATDEKGCWSLPSHWMDYYGPVGDETAGFAIFDHPQNFRYPTTWHVRGYGLFAPNCWMFKPDHHLDAGEALTFRWRVTIHTGDTNKAQIGARFLDYVDGMRLEADE
ncbi:TPA: hypothetical protein DCE37_20065 [Candidatus Latescibacteria bacterium]|nr:hypothetical protein [Candidatus Latescibacterota bacterium]